MSYIGISTYWWYVPILPSLPLGGMLRGPAAYNEFKLICIVPRLRDSVLSRRAGLHHLQLRRVRSHHVPVHRPLAGPVRYHHQQHQHDQEHEHEHEQ